MYTERFLSRSDTAKKERKKQHVDEEIHWNGDSLPEGFQALPSNPSWLLSTMNSMLYTSRGFASCRQRRNGYTPAKTRGAPTTSSGWIRSVLTLLTSDSVLLSCW